MNFLKYKDADDWLKRNDITTEEGLVIVEAELQKLLK